MLTDNELIEKAKKGDEVALDSLMSRYKQLASKIARSYFLVGAEYDDLLQEAMIGLYKAYTNYEINSKTSFSTFAHMCITRNVQSAIKIANRKKNVFLNQGLSLSSQGEVKLNNDDDITLVIPSPSPSPDEKLIHSENLQDIKEKIISTLSSFEQKVLSLYLKGYSYKDISSLLDVTSKSIDNALSRIRKKLSFLNDLQKNKQ